MSKQAWRGGPEVRRAVSVGKSWPRVGPQPLERSGGGRYPWFPFGFALLFCNPGTELLHMSAPWLVGVFRKINPCYLAAACTALFFCVGCDNTEVNTLPPEARVARTSTGALAAGDVIRISFSGTPELNQVQAIDGSGRISLPLIGEVTAAGKQLKAFQDELSERYKSQLQNTQVIIAQEKSAIPVILSGAVQRPGKLILEEQTTALEAILQAGGATNIGNLKKVRIIRIVNGKHYTQVINLSPAMQGRPSSVFYVKYGDIIYVPERLF